MTTQQREMLELAAKAAGIDFIGWDDFNEGFSAFDADTDVNYRWNPLEDDGDALRLAVKLGMLYTYGCERFELFQKFYLEELDKDLRSSEATRRAIVRAAAEIGRAMP